MKEKLDVLSQSLQNELTHLQNEKSELLDKVLDLNNSRAEAARLSAEELLPDLNMNTVYNLEEEVPGFEVPKVSKWLGFSEKVDPDVSINTVRMQLISHLNNTNGLVPELWETNVRSIDDKIGDLQENIRINEKKITDLTTQVSGVERLLVVDTSKMNPEVREKLEQAVKNVKPFQKPVKTQKTFGSVSQRNREETNSGPDLLQLWLMTELLTSHGELSQEVSRVEEFTGQGGTFGGSGASAGWDNNTDQQSTDNSQLSANEAELAAQEDLGSQNFS